MSDKQRSVQKTNRVKKTKFVSASVKKTRTENLRKKYKTVREVREGKELKLRYYRKHNEEI